MPSEGPDREALGLMRTHVETAFTLNANGRMRRVNTPDGAAAPRPHSQSGNQSAIIAVTLLGPAIDENLHHLRPRVVR